jgi:hypothetical protein
MSITRIAEHRTPVRFLAAVALVGLLGSASAPALSEDRAEAIDATEARDFPQAIFDRIIAKITYQTTFQHVSPRGIVRWSPRTIKLIEFVKAASPTYPDTELYAMRYTVWVFNEKETLAGSRNHLSGRGGAPERCLFRAECRVLAG